jgi:hypothetical protein
MKERFKGSGLLSLFLCLAIGAFFAYKAVDDENRITFYRREIPMMQKKLAEIREENRRLFLQIETFENPQHLMEILRQPEYSHLKFPKQGEVRIVHRIPAKSNAT